MGVLRTALMDSLQRDRGGTSRMTAWPAPLLGLNTRDNIANMLPGFARVLDNLYPGSGQCESRGGSEITHIGIPLGGDEATAGASSLFPYGNDKLFAGGSNGIWDVTPGTAIALAMPLAFGMMRGCQSTSQTVQATTTFG
jgi:hypothetical protein